MQINITSGTGVGPTELSAFDQALVNANVANFNLIYLSSVLPVGSEVIMDKKSREASNGNWGDKLYVVIAQSRSSVRNEEVWAGIGWVQDPETKRGLLVEHVGHSESEVKSDIESSLQALSENRGLKLGPINTKVVGTRCEDLPVCALVVAVFEAAQWNATK